VSAIDLFGTTFQNPILLAAGTAGFGRELDVGLRGIGRYLNHIAQLAVDLHGDFQRALDQEGRIELRPGSVSERDCREPRVERREPGP